MADRDDRCFVRAEDIFNDRWIQREVTKELADRLLETNTWLDISFCGPWPGAKIVEELNG